MKILILTVTVGGGHNAAASALAEGLISRGADVSLANLYDITSPIKGKLLDWGYRFATSYLPRAYGLFYRRQENRKSSSYKSSRRRRRTAKKAVKLKEFIDNNSYDVILFTHVFCGELLDSIREIYGLSAQVIGVVTDYTLHPYWEEALRADKILVASEYTVESAVKKGFLQEKILSLGIPVRERFYDRREKGAARKELSLDESVSTVLIMSGSMGYGGIAKTVKAIDRAAKGLQLICVCGDNGRARKKIDRLRSNNRILNLGYTENVDVLMDASDVIVTKPGGITVSEAMAKRLPIIIYKEIPGPEPHNAKYLTELGVAVEAKSRRELCEHVKRLTGAPSLLEGMKKSIEKNRTDGAVAAICREILKSDKKTEKSN